ncbi:SPASM domain-containing protein [Brachyspira hampsonii]|uniref:SPASM domain-containing protein n=1 Tax=Brachyspira hampsonii TaxID=1287055 RepID=UPI000D3C6759|nr:SPASM domain-containing protein [Brachyspira hampsonii]
MLLQASSDLQLNNQGGSIDIENCDNKFEAKRCPSIKNLQISKDGDIILCCKDYYRTNIMGNFIKDGGIVKVYSSYKKLRERLLKDNIADLEICKKCLGRE